MGAGKALLDELVDLATAHGFHSMIARIADHNAASIALHRSLGFEEVGTEREVGRKFRRWIDVLVMQRLLYTLREWWAGEDLNLRRRSRRVYSPLPLATRAPTQDGRD